jgi:hypothetical protein
LPGVDAVADAQVPTEPGPAGLVGIAFPLVGAASTQPAKFVLAAKSIAAIDIRFALHSATDAATAAVDAAEGGQAIGIRLARLAQRATNAGLCQYRHFFVAALLDRDAHAQLDSGERATENTTRFAFAARVILTRAQAAGSPRVRPADSTPALGVIVAGVARGLVSRHEADPFHRPLGQVHTAEGGARAIVVVGARNVATATVGAAQIAAALLVA